MKTEIFTYAIRKRRKIKFVYGAKAVILEPYFISINKYGRKVIFGRVDSTYEIREFEFIRIVNIKLLFSKKFSPIIPILKTA